MIGRYILTHNRTVIYTFDPADLTRCLDVAQARADAKLGVARDDGHRRSAQDYDPRLLHMLGLRAEWAFCRMFGIDPPTDVSTGGDKHEADVFFPYIGKSFEIKYTDYAGDSPLFTLATTNLDDFRADFGVLLKRVLGGRRNHPYAPNIEFYGYLDRKTFQQKSEVRNLGYGPRRIVQTQYLTPFMGFLDRLTQYYNRRETLARSEPTPRI